MQRKTLCHIYPNKFPTLIHLARGENLRWMPPRCFQDASRCLHDATRMSPHDSQMLSTRPSLLGSSLQPRFVNKHCLGSSAWVILWKRVRLYRCHEHLACIFTAMIRLHLSLRIYRSGDLAFLRGEGYFWVLGSESQEVCTHHQGKRMYKVNVECLCGVWVNVWCVSVCEVWVLYVLYVCVNKELNY